MKILQIIGSGRKHGNSDQFVALINVHLQAEAERTGTELEIESVYLIDQSIGFCRGCRSCFNLGESKCPLKDDLQTIKAKMDAADGLLVITPVYVDDVGALVKNWIDRLAYLCHRPAFASKCAYIIATVGSSPTSHALRTLTVALSTWGFQITGQAGLKMGALMKPDETRARFDAQAGQIARKFFRAIHTHAFTKPTFLSLMMFRIQQFGWNKTDPEKVDYQYWKNQGWLDPRRDFYVAHQGSRIKVALARFTGSVIARFVT